MSIHIEPRYLAHEGGTKFYEVIQFHNLDEKRFVVVKRWGPMGKSGEVKIDSYPTLRKAQQEADKIIRSKEGRGYALAKSTSGFHGLATDDLDATEMKRRLGVHYRSDHANIIASNLCLRDDEIVADDSDQDDVVIEEPAPEPERGEEWGSW